MISKKDIITIIPFVMVGMSGISGYLSSKEIYLRIFKYLPDSIGYSLLTGLVFMYFYFRKSFCLPVKFAVSSLVFMNVVSIVFKTLDYNYNYMYDFYITIVIFLISIIYIINKCF